MFVCFFALDTPNVIFSTSTSGRRIFLTFFHNQFNEVLEKYRRRTVTDNMMVLDYCFMKNTCCCCCCKCNNTGKGTAFTISVVRWRQKSQTIMSKPCENKIQNGLWLVNRKHISCVVCMNWSSRKPNIKASGTFWRYTVADIDNNIITPRLIKQQHIRQSANRSTSKAKWLDRYGNLLEGRSKWLSWH